MPARTLAFLLALLACPFLGHAQEPFLSGIGYMGGPQVATWHSEATVYRPIPGFVLGFYAPVRAGNRMELQPELLVSVQGAAKDLPDGEHNTMRSLNAILPVSFKVFIGQSLFLQAGGQAGYLLYGWSTQKQDISDQLNTLDLGVNIGIGIGTYYGMDLSLRYYNGLSNTLAKDHTLFPYNRTLQFTAGYRLVQFARHHRRR